MALAAVPGKREKSTSNKENASRDSFTHHLKSKRNRLAICGYLQRIFSSSIDFLQVVEGKKKSYYGQMHFSGLLFLNQNVLRREKTSNDQNRTIFMIPYGTSQKKSERRRPRGGDGRLTGQAALPICLSPREPCPSASLPSPLVIAEQNLT